MDDTSPHLGTGSEHLIGQRIKIKGQPDRFLLGSLLMTGPNGGPYAPVDPMVGLPVTIINDNSSNSVRIEELPPVDVNSMPPVAIATMPSVDINSLPSISISNMPGVTISSMPSVTVASLPEVTLHGTPAVTISSLPSLTIGSMPAVGIVGTTTIAGTVNIGNVPNVIVTGTVNIGTMPAVTISGTPAITVTSGNIAVTGTVTIASMPNVTLAGGTIVIAGADGVAIPGSLTEPTLTTRGLVVRQIPNDNRTVQVLASGTRTTSSTFDFTNTNAVGVEVVLDITNFTLVGTVSLTIQGYDSVSGKYFTLLASTSLAVPGTTVLTLHPSATPVANLIAGRPLRRDWRLRVDQTAIGITYSVSYNYLY